MILAQLDRLRRRGNGRNERRERLEEMTAEEIAMKIRIGVGFAGWPFERTEDFWEFVDLVEESGLDSIWLNDRIRNPMRVIAQP
jgi:hypothetical protein